MKKWRLGRDEDVRELMSRNEFQAVRYLHGRGSGCGVSLLVPAQQLLPELFPPPSLLVVEFALLFDVPYPGTFCLAVR